MYLVMKAFRIIALPDQEEMQLADLIEGCDSAVLIFKTKEAALDFAEGDEALIIPVKERTWENMQEEYSMMRE